MKIIETERWVPSKEDPSRSEYIGQRTGQEVFEELRQQLENMGCLPDEYFLLDQRWENGREIPEGADIFCTTDYGASEGMIVFPYRAISIALRISPKASLLTCSSSANSAEVMSSFPQ